ncbi:lysophospholipase [Oscillospiraceae bacterium CM]|nr:lysophospholipase [Oscillospiraceae bacterium CM]
MSCLSEFNLSSSDGKSRLHIMQWLPDDRNVKAVLQLAHGVTEHIGRYDTFARFMANNGFAVIGNSHLGHGRSAATEEDLGFFTEKGGWDFAVRDLHLVFESARAKFPGLPYFLLGHSMGSFLTRTFLTRYQNILSGCIISGTGQPAAALIHVGLLLSSVQKLLYGARKQSAALNLLCFGAYNRRVNPLRTPCDWLTRDVDLVDRFIADNTCGFVPTVGLFSDLLGGIQFVGRKKNIAHMQKDLPILFVSGDQDPVGDFGFGVRKVQRLFTAAGLDDVTVKMYQGARHEVLNETIRQDVFNDILDWLLAKLSKDKKKAAP